MKQRISSLLQQQQTFILIECNGTEDNSEEGIAYPPITLHHVRYTVIKFVKETKLARCEQFYLRCAKIFTGSVAESFSIRF